MTETHSRHDLVMMAVGIALGKWNQVETGVGLLFLAVSGIDNPYRAGAMFDAIVSFDARLRVLNAAMEHEQSLSADELGAWKALSSRLGRAYKKRHEIVHFTSGAVEAIEEGAGIFPYFTWNKHHANRTKLLAVGQIQERGEKFAGLSRDVMAFASILQPRKPPIKSPPRSD